MALLTQSLKWSRSLVEVLLAGVRLDLRSRAVHPYKTCELLLSV
jgi:hypothetical protein